MINKVAIKPRLRLISAGTSDSELDEAARPGENFRLFGRYQVQPVYFKFTGKRMLSFKKRKSRWVSVLYRYTPLRL